MASQAELLQCSAHSLLKAIVVNVVTWNRMHVKICPVSVWMCGSNCVLLPPTHCLNGWIGGWRAGLSNYHIYIYIYIFWSAVLYTLPQSKKALFYHVNPLASFFLGFHTAKRHRNFLAWYYIQNIQNDSLVGDLSFSYCQDPSKPMKAPNVSSATLTKPLLLLNSGAIYFYCDPKIY